MTRFLNLDDLRANEAPVRLNPGWPNPVWPNDEPGRLQRRPRLAAVWRIAPSGRPVCRWQIDDDDTDPAG